MTNWKSPRCSQACWDEIKQHDAERVKLVMALADMTRDRDEWKHQHENLLAMYQAKHLPDLPQRVGWRTDLENAPSEAYKFFLVRPRGNHPGRGGPFHPTIVQRIDGKFYTSDNELDPIYFGQDEPDDSPFKTTLEWQPFPADWMTASQLSRPSRGGENG